MREAAKRAKGANRGPKRRKTRRLFNSDLNYGNFWAKFALSAYAADVTAYHGMGRGIPGAAVKKRTAGRATIRKAPRVFYVQGVGGGG